MLDFDCQKYVWYTNAIESIYQQHMSLGPSMKVRSSIHTFAISEVSLSPCLNISIIPCNTSNSK